MKSALLGKKKMNGDVFLKKTKKQKQKKTSAHACTRVGGLGLCNIDPSLYSLPVGP